MMQNNNMNQKFLDSKVTVQYIKEEVKLCKEIYELKDSVYNARSTSECVYVTFRGSQEFEDLVADLEVIPKNRKDIENGYTHFGFTERANMAKIIEEIYSQAVRDKKLLIIGGHSLGGAAASICAFDLLKNHPDSDNIYCITFGAPFAFSHEILDYAKDTNMYRHFIHFIDEYDIIPYTTYYLVPSLMGIYLPLGEYYFIRHEESYISLELQKNEKMIAERRNKNINPKNHFIVNYGQYKSSPEMDLYTRLKLPIYTPFETIYYHCTRMNYDDLELHEKEAYDILRNEKKITSYMNSMIDFTENDYSEYYNVIDVIFSRKVPHYYTLNKGYKVMPSGMYDYLFMNHNNEIKGNIPILSYNEMMDDNRLNYDGFNNITYEEKQYLIYTCNQQCKERKKINNEGNTEKIKELSTVGFDVTKFVLQKNTSGAFFASYELINFVWSVGRDLIKERAHKKYRSRSEQKLYNKQFWNNFRHHSLTLMNLGISSLSTYLVGSVLTGVSSFIGGVAGIAVFAIMNQVTRYFEGEEREILKEDITKLETIKEAGRMIFDNYDEDDDDKISKNECKTLMRDIYRLSKLECPYNINYIIDQISSADGKVHWNEFWSWLSYRLFDQECDNININNEDIDLVKDIEVWSDLKSWLYSFSNDGSKYSMWRFLTDWKIDYPIVKSRKAMICYVVKEIPNHFRKVLRDEYFYDDIPDNQLKRMLASIGGNYKMRDKRHILIESIKKQLKEIV